MAEVKSISIGQMLARLRLARLRVAVAERWMIELSAQPLRPVLQNYRFICLALHQHTYECANSGLHISALVPLGPGSARAQIDGAESLLTAVVGFQNKSLRQSCP